MQEQGVRDLLAIPILRSLSISGASLCFTATSFDSVFVLFCYTPILDGGLNFSVRCASRINELFRRLTISLQTSQIGYALAIAGTSSITIQILILPTLLIKFQHAHLYNFCMFMWPVAFVVMPFLNYFVYSRLQLWAAIAILLSISRVACLAYS